MIDYGNYYSFKEAVLYTSYSPMMMADGCEDRVVEIHATMRDTTNSEIESFNSKYWKESKERANIMITTTQLQNTKNYLEDICNTLKENYKDTYDSETQQGKINNLIEKIEGLISDLERVRQSLDTSIGITKNQLEEAQQVKNKLDTIIATYS